jgi:hypothetical protein
MKRWIWACVCAAMLVAGGVAQKPADAAKKGAPAPAVAAKPLLPDAFAGWVADEVKPLADASAADAANAAALKEYALTDAATAAYKRDGATLTVRALRFHDATGAFGAYSLYRQNNWAKEKVGSGAASFHDRVLFWQGNIVIDANFAHVNAMSGAELRELARQLPPVSDTLGALPPLIGNLPQKDLETHTTHYALGQVGYLASGGVLPASIVGFEQGAESLTANYSLSSGPATLTMIDYPTPQLAMVAEARIRAYLQAGAKAQPAWTKALQDSDTASLEVLRSGPVVVVVSGDAIPKESHRLIEMVHFDADVMAMPAGNVESETQKTAKLLMGIAALVIIGGGAAILLGFFLGGGRALYRIARGKPASTMYEAEFIRIDLTGNAPEVEPSADKQHPKG